MNLNKSYTVEYKLILSTNFKIKMRENEHEVLLIIYIIFTVVITEIAHIKRHNKMLLPVILVYNIITIVIPSFITLEQIPT